MPPEEKNVRNKEYFFKYNVGLAIDSRTSYRCSNEYSCNIRYLLLWEK